MPFDLRSRLTSDWVGHRPSALAASLPKHMPALDGLRAVAILLVIAIHVAFFSVLVLPNAWTNAIAHYLGNGVQLFFVVSAFTLTMRFEREGTDLKGYALRRVARIGPAYWAAAAVYGVTGILGVGPAGEMPITWGLAASTTVFGCSFSSCLVPGGWSISCEAFFYLALPLWLWLINGRIWRAVLLLVLLIAAAQLRARPRMLESGLNFQFLAHPFEQYPVFMLGVLAALVVSRYRLPKIPFAAELALFAAICVVPVVPVNHWTLIKQIQFAFPAAVAVMYAAVYPPAFLSNRVMREIGKVSYSMYLVHWAVVGTTVAIGKWLTNGDNWGSAAVAMVLCTAAAFLISWVTYWLIEKPAIDWAKIRTRGIRKPSGPSRLPDVEPAALKSGAP
jgi:peptidoglycan/LPS O-acetylase OafA/YrhL